jgi:hypothetical protein
MLSPYLQRLAFTRERRKGQDPDTVWYAFKPGDVFSRVGVISQMLAVTIQLLPIRADRVKSCRESV